MMIAPSVSARRRAGQDREDVGQAYEWRGDGRGGGGEGRDAGHDLGLELVGEPVVHVHVGPVEQRITLGQDHDGAAGIEVHREARRRLLVELGHRTGIAAGMSRRAGRHRIAQLLLDDAVRDEVGGDAAGVRLLADAGVERDDVRLGDQAGCLEGHELGVARAEPDAIEPAGHSCSCAIALSAEAAIAEPPRRPCTVR
jgi:hypothetical protein